MKKNLRRVFALLLTVCMVVSILAIPALADDSTTTFTTVYKDNSANTEIYVVTDTPGSDYPVYGAKHEPTGGVYFGRTAQGGSFKNADGSKGPYGTINTEELKNASVVSFYYGLTGYSLDSTGHVWDSDLKISPCLSYWSYIYGGYPPAEKPLMDGNHALLIYLNFAHEKSDCTKVINGTFDIQLKEDFQYLASLSFPVYLRIAGEMNVWNGITSPSSAKSFAPTFIKAYQHIAQLARQYAPNVALVFSPNYSSAYEVDMDVFYPGDSYVDWIGASLYYNRYSNTGDRTRDAFYGVGAYGDAMLNIQQIVNLSKLHKKPIMITEGGSAWKMGSEDTSAFAADRVQKAYTYLSMVYPQIKAILYSDYVGHDGNYTLYGNEPGNKTMTAAYNKGVSANATFLHSIKDQPKYYTKLSAFSGELSGNVTLTAYTFSDALSAKPTATWYVDGAAKATVKDYPYTYTLDANALGGGNHTVEVRFSNGAKKSYTVSTGHIHAWDNGKLTTPMTATQDGVVTYTCKVCGETQTTILPAGGSPFVDVQNAKKYYYTPVLWAVENGITNGTTAFTFSPDDPCTRGQVVTFLWRAAGKPEPTSTDNPFTDVTEGKFYYKAVLWAVENGITNGITSTTFEPNSPCTRGQVVTFLWRTAGKPEPTSTANPFNDVAEGKFYYKSVLWAVEDGITNGITATTFEPGTTCSRGQIVTFLYRHFG